jgi:hypothetical protein
MAANPSIGGGGKISVAAFLTGKSLQKKRQIGFHTAAGRPVSPG